LNNSKYENKLSVSLQQDILKIKDKKIFLNPFLYSRKFDSKTKKWLKEPGQISSTRIALNRNRFYPELEWGILSSNEKLSKDITVELFLKTIDIIKTFHPYLNSEQLLEVEKKLTFAKKRSFEKWSDNYLLKKNRLLLKEENSLKRASFINSWKRWLSLKETKKSFIFIFVIIVTSAFIGWLAGISKNSCNPYFESTNSYLL
tara:strand:+ start:385 stop:990 length:606 start_codon:yes stop_codon:yes gene_type:complete